MSEVLAFPTQESLADVVAANIRAETARLRIEQREVARALGMSQPAISDRYRGKTAWTLNEVEAVARFLGTTASDLVRHQGLEPRTRWFGAWSPVRLRALVGLALDRHRRSPAEVVSLSAYRAARLAVSA